VPRFSVIIACYNQAAFIRDAVGSVLGQEFTGSEVIVVDDASTDGSKDVLKGYGGAIRLVSLETNGGACAARNTGAALAQGDYLVFLDGDDLLLPWALRLQSRIIDLKSPALILCKMRWFTESFVPADMGGAPGEIRLVVYEAFMKKDRPFRSSASCVVIERRNFARVGGFAQEFWPIEDADLLLKLGYSGRTISVMAPPTTAYRQHANNVSRKIQPLINGVHLMIRKERANQYPGGGKSRLERHAVLGGIVYYWCRTAFRQKLYWEWLKLVAVGWPLVLAAICRRGKAVFAGRLPVETVPMAE
jgi:glycosyltransferase involved in cell wall biosynthesis